MNKRSQKLFSKYAFTGKYAEQQTRDLIKKSQIYEELLSDADSRSIGRQYYIYSKLKEQSVYSNTELELYLELLVREIDRQFIRKSQMETRAGLLLALWGVMTIAFVENYTAAEVTCDSPLKMLVLGILAVLGFMIIIYLMTIMRTKSMKVYDFNGDWYDLHAAMEHKEFTIIRFIEGYRNSFVYNEQLLKKVGRDLDVSTILQIMYIAMGIGILVIKRVDIL